MKGVEQVSQYSQWETLASNHFEVTPGFGGDDVVSKRTSNYFPIPELTYTVILTNKQNA